MFTIKQTYIDFDGIERTENFYFNLTEAEITEMQLTREGGLYAFLKKIIDSKDQTKLMNTFKELVLKAYGKKSDDGRRFIKNDEVRADFEQTQAFSDIYMRLVLDDVFAAEFVNKILPDTEKLANKVKNANINNVNS